MSRQIKQEQENSIQSSSGTTISTADNRNGIGSDGNGSGNVSRNGSGNGLGYDLVNGSTVNAFGTRSSGNGLGNGLGNKPAENDLNELLKLKMVAMEAKLKMIESEQKLANLENKMKWERSERERQKKDEEMGNLVALQQRQIKALKERNGHLEQMLKDLRKQKNHLNTQMHFDYNRQDLQQMEEEEEEDGGEGGFGEMEEGQEEVVNEQEVGNEENEPEEEEETGQIDEEEADQPFEQPIEQQQEEEKANDEAMDLEIIEVDPLGNALQQPPATIRGQFIRTRDGQREYHFLKTAKSLQMLNNIRFEKYCKYNGKKPLKIKQPIVLPCSKKSKEKCDFELLAFPTGLEDKIIHVYEHSQHNHPIMAVEKRACHIVKKETLPDENPEEFYHTEDLIKWKFLQTLPNEEQMKKFCGENHCPPKPRSKRFPCNRKLSHNCKFMLLTLKTTQLGYHVYKHGEHNSHSDKNKIATNGQKAAKNYDQRKQRQMKK